MPDLKVTYRTTEHSASTTRPTLIIGYQSTVGVYNHWTYNRVSAGTAGEILVSDYTGELTLIRNDINFSTELQSLNLTMSYNNSESTINYGFGNGWISNYNMYLEQDTNGNYFTVDSTGGRVSYASINCPNQYPETVHDCYVAEDGSGSLLVFLDNLSGPDKTFVVTSEHILFYFNVDNGRLESIHDDKSDVGVYVHYESSTSMFIDYIEDFSKNRIEIEYKTGTNYVDYIQLELCQVHLNDTCSVSSVVEKIEYGYVDGTNNIETVTYKKDYNGDGTMTTDFAATYQYLSGKIASASSSQGEKQSITYIGDQVNVINSYMKTYPTSTLTYSYDYKNTTITNHLGDSVSYLFDNYGHTVQLMSSDGFVQTFKYLNPFSHMVNSDTNIYFRDDENYNYFLNHRKVYQSNGEYVSFNSISNNSFENYSSAADDPNWDFVIDDLAGASPGLVADSYSSMYSVDGTKSAYMSGYYGQDYHYEYDLVLDAGTYNINGFIRNSGTGSSAYLIVSGATYDSSDVEYIGPNQQWNYVDLTFEVANDNQVVTILLKRVDGGNGGTAYFDNIRLVGDHNLMENPSFEVGSTDWLFDTGVQRSLSNIDVSSPYYAILQDYSIEIHGNTDITRSAEYDITSLIDTSLNAQYTLSLWAYSEGTPVRYDSSDDDRVFRARVEYKDSSGNTIYEQMIDFDPTLIEWTNLSTSLTIPSTTNEIILHLEYRGLGYVRFDGIKLSEGMSGLAYEYSNTGALLSTNANGLVTAFNYLLSSTDNTTIPPLSKPVSMDTKYHHTEIPENSDYLPEYYEVNNVRVTPDYNNYGQVIETLYGDDVINFSTSTTYLSSGFGQYIESVTDEYSNTTTYDFDLLTGLLESITNARTETTSYTYYDDGLLHKVINSHDENCIDCSKTEYTYNVDNQLIEIKMQDNYKYTINYDDQGRMLSVYVENGSYSQDLMSYTYVDENGYYTSKINRQTYGNEDFIEFTYDDEDRVSEVKYNDSTQTPVTRFSYKYDDMGRLKEFNTHDDSGVIIETEKYSYTPSGQLLFVIDQDGNKTEYGYNAEGELTKLMLDIDGLSEHIVNYDMYQDVLRIIDMQDEKELYGNWQINYSTQFNNIIEGSSSTSYNGEIISLSTTSSNDSPSYSGVIQVVNSGEYDIKLNILSNIGDDEITITVYEYTDYPFLEDGSYNAGSFLTDTTSSPKKLGELSHNVTLNENTKFMIISLSTSDLDGFDITFEDFVVDYVPTEDVTLYDKTSYSSQDLEQVIKDYTYEENALRRLDFIDLTNNAFTITQDYIYYQNTTRISEIEYRVDTDDVDSDLNYKIEYKYTYDVLGNISSVQYWLDGTLEREEDYVYDSLNQLIEESQRDDFTQSTYNDTNYTKIYSYDNRGNITEIKSFTYHGADSTDANIPSEYRTNLGNYDIFETVSGDTTLSIGQSLSLSYNYYLLDGSFPPNSVPVPMITTCDPNTVNIYVTGYYVYECQARAKFGTDYMLDFGVLVKVGNPIGTPTTPKLHVVYNYSTDWLDQLESTETVVYDSDGVETGRIIDYQFTYDEQGNPTAIKNFRYEGNSTRYAELDYQGRQLIKIEIYTNESKTTLLDTITYTYNDQGYRTSKTVGNDTVEYYLEGDKVLYESNGTHSLLYTYDYDGTIISFNYDSNINDTTPGEEYYYIRNIQGDITKIIDGSGNIVVEYYYDAWGNIIDVVDTSTINLSEINPYRYRGYRYDEEIGLYYLNSRFYNPDTGRFINADGLLGQQGNILGHNMYAYTQNNPVMLTDSTGYAPEWLSWENVGFAVFTVAVVALTITTLGTGTLAVGLFYGSLSTVSQVYSNYKNGVALTSGLTGAFVGGYISGVLPGFGGAVLSGFVGAGINFVENGIYQKGTLSENVNRFLVEGLSYSIGNVIMNKFGSTTLFGVNDYRFAFALLTDFVMYERIDYINDCIQNKDQIEFDILINGN